MPTTPSEFEGWSWSVSDSFTAELHFVNGAWLFDGKPVPSALANVLPMGEVCEIEVYYWTVKEENGPEKRKIEEIRDNNKALNVVQDEDIAALFHDGMWTMPTADLVVWPDD